ncbi:hypothetical protein F0562_029247 [Nyssa sinensis]|uniref:Uncharacterized protein n=1 Tax=Nyssa sinensis TaxID=561372 RepID=A0A5J5B235_9ASTE|nr:hypothetical protein F0562_029247 [Nyssa sinensis]
MEGLETATKNNGETSTPDLQNPSNGVTAISQEPNVFSDDIDSSCSTPYVSAPSSPGRGPSLGGFYYSAPTSPTHFVLSSSPNSPSNISEASVSGSFEFEFSARFAANGSASAGSMSSADELFLNGKIRPMKLSTHLQRPQALAPLLDVDETEVDGDDEKITRGRDVNLRDRSLRRRTRSMSPLRSTSFEWYKSEETNENSDQSGSNFEDVESKQNETASNETTPCMSASSSRSSSAGRTSKRWVFLKDFLYRSKSEGRNNGHKFWSSISFSPVKDRKLWTASSKDKSATTTTEAASAAETKKVKQSVREPNKKPAAGKVSNGIGKRRVPRSAHELHYTANRAQAEEMRKKTFLPYRQGLLGCLGFSSKSYGAMNGFARALNPVSSRVTPSFGTIREALIV